MFLKEKILGCLIGGAIGDSFGYPVECLESKEIKEQFGAKGLTYFIADNDSGKFLISDDTQMTMFTLEALILNQKKDVLINDIYKSYRRWFDTQFGPGAIDTETASEGFLHQDERLFAMRMPGHACIDSMRKGIMGTPDKPISLSKGNGCVMRAAPFGFLQDESPEYVYSLSYNAAALTHGDEEAQQCAAAFSTLIYFLIRTKFIADAIIMNDDLLLKIGKRGVLAKKVIDRGLDAVLRGKCSRQFWKKLGEGWIAPEALSIAIYFLVSTQYHDTKSRLCSIINRTGDSDTIASIFGNLWGAFWGIHAFKDMEYQNIECIDLMSKLVDKFFRAHPSLQNKNYPKPSQSSLF